MMSTPNSDFEQFQRRSADALRLQKIEFWVGFAAGAVGMLGLGLAVAFGKLAWAAMGAW